MLLVLKHHTCVSKNKEKCGSSINSMNVGEYSLLKTYTNLLQSILNLYPRMEKLIECQLVKDALSQIILKHCKPLKIFSRMTWIAVMFLAVFMVFFLVIWTIRACQDHSRHHRSDCPV
ncbi:hypothetical protein V8G54_024550 [Vigna mungo]|uniref:Uncharacterized protein n=1 Tax=Vigna mungo TaxID=3915 RepID=A0AAQ3RQ81_VIGMU